MEKRKQRWMFCNKELDNPEACNGYDIMYLDTGTEERIQGFRNGDTTDRWEDGTAGVPLDVQEWAQEDEQPFNPECGEYIDVWKEVWADEVGNFLGWGDRPFQEGIDLNRLIREEIEKILNDDNE